MIRLKKRSTYRMKASVAILLLASLFLCMAATAWAGSITWTTKADFDTATQNNIDTDTEPDAFMIGVPKDFTSLATITPVTAYNRVYTTGTDRKSIAVIDPATKQVLRTVPLEGVVAGAIYDSGASNLYIGYKNLSSISIVNITPDAESIQTVSVGSTATTAFVAAYDPAPERHKLYVVRPADAEVVILNGTTYQEIARKKVTAGITMATLANGKVYLTNNANRFLNIVDGNTNEVDNVQITPEENILGGTAPGNVGLRVADLAAKGITSGEVITLSWKYLCSPNLKAPETIQLQVRPAADASSFDASYYRGPGDDREKWYEVVCPTNEPETYEKTESVVLDVPFTNAIEVQVKLTSGGISTPIVREVSLQYDTFPDLVATPPTLSDSVATGGSTLHISSGITNIGNSAAAGSTASINLVGMGTSTVLATVGVPELGPSFPIAVDVTIPSAAFGDYSIEICADSAGVVRETNENNNCASKPLQVTYPDLVVSDVSGPGTLIIGSSYSISNSVLNQERVAAGPFKVKLYLTNGTKDYEIGQRNIAGLQAGQTDTASTQVTIPYFTDPSLRIPTGEEYHLKACADTDSAVRETIEDNNCFVSPAQVAVYSVEPDLVVKSVQGTIVANGKIQYTVVVKNMGTTRVNNVYSGVFLSPDSTITGSGDDLWIANGSGLFNSVIDGLATVTLTGIGDLPINKRGVFYVGAQVDRTNSITTDYNKSNNCLAGNQVTVTNDLVVEPGSLSGTVVNGKLNYSVTVSNRGNGRVGTVNVGIFLSSDDIIIPPIITAPGNDMYVSTSGSSAPVIPGGTSVTMTGSGDVPLNIRGTYYVGAEVDRTHTIDEDNEDNNTMAGNQVTITNDLVIEPGSLSGTAVDGKLNYSVTVSNRGNGRVGTVYLGIFLSSDDVITPAVITAPGNDMYISTSGSTVSVIAGGASVIMSGSGDLPPNLDGTYYVGAYVDRTGTIDEDNEDNNGLAANQVTIRQDLVVTNFNYSVANRTITYSGTIDNRENGLAGPVYCGVFLSRDNVITLDGSDIYIIGSCSASKVSKGAPGTVSGSGTLPTNLSGTYYVGMYVDRTGSVPETNEDNNYMVSPTLLTFP